MSLVSLKMSRKDMAEEVAPDQPQYPYGVCLHLDTDELEKLGIKNLPSVGDEYHIVADGEVTSVSERDAGNGEQRGLDIQIQMIELTHEDEAEITEDVESVKAEAAETSSVGSKPKTVLRNAYRGTGAGKNDGESDGG